MESSRVSVAGKAGMERAMSPVTWDPTPLPSAMPGLIDGTDQTPSFEPTELRDDPDAFPDQLGDSFGEGEAERTLVVSAAYELRPRFTGRAGALARLSELTDRAFDDREAAFLEVLGEPGMGKTALLAELRAAAADRRARVAGGKATEFERLPFAMFSDAFGDAWTDLLAYVDTPDGRAALYRSARSLLPGTVLVLDDVHWADEASVELIEHLLRHPPDGPAVLAMAYRPRQLPDRLATAFSALGREDWWRRIEVGPLTPAEAAQLCGESVPAARRAELFLASGGNPFYLDALLRLDPGDSEELPDTVRAVLIGELAYLAPPVRLVAQAAAVLGEEFEAGLIGAVAQTDAIDTLNALDELIARDLIRQSVAGQRFQFRHPLLRSVVYSSAGAGWRIGVATVALYLLEGLAGIPVFAGATAGPAYFLGTTAGFLVAYLPKAYVIGRAADAGAAGNVALLFGFMVLGDAIVFAGGFAWLLVVANMIVSSGGELPGWLQGGSLMEVAYNGAVKPFILWDLLKMAFAAMTVAGIWVAVRKRS